MLETLAPPAASGRILIVDDGEFNRELLEALLTGWGYACEMAASGGRGAGAHGAGD